ncbi:MAG: DUF4097 family beta strand repeat protein [Calditrichae bacterium]|nr:DUF4097 family beta strand repeat protein [Calditrichota bacterium]MCB9058275.1 DUF4097 family beta strand repeat protein [Calditrichia bacterium]
MKSGIYVWAFILFIFSIAFAKDLKKDFSHTFNVSDGAILILENGDGNVNIKTWEKDQIQVDVVYHAQIKSSSQTDIDKFDIEFSQNGNKVYVIERNKRKLVLGYFSINYIDYRYDIFVPSYTKVDIQADDGDIVINDLKANVRIKGDDGKIELKNIFESKMNLHTQDGRINLENVSGILNIKSDDGDVFINDISVSEAEISGSDGKVKIKNSRGDFYITTDDGDVTLDKITSHVLDVRTQDGDIDVRFAGRDNVDISLSTNDGRVNLDLDNPISAAFSIENDDGHIRFNLDDADISRDSKHLLKGNLGNGEGRLKIRTSDGSVSVNNAF